MASPGLNKSSRSDMLSKMDALLKSQQSITPLTKKINLSDDRRKSALTSPIISATANKKKVTTMIVEIGARWTRYGCIGEVYPRPFLDSRMMVGKKKHHVLTNDLEPAEKKGILLKFMKRVFTNCFPDALIRFVLVENLFMSEKEKKLLIHVLFDCLRVAEVMFVPAPIGTIMAYGRDTGLIINVGYNETTVYPVVNNLILLKCYESGYGARHFHEEVENYLKERGKIRDENGEIKKLDETDMKNFIEDGLVEDLALISMATRKDRGLLLRNWDYEHAEDHFQFAPDVEIQLRSKTLIVSGFLREALAECFFISEKESDSPSIQELIYRSLKNCPVDYRKQLANSLIITGGTRRMKGFVGRLRRELRDLFATQDGGLMKHLCDEIKFPTTPQDVGIEKYDAWLGATLYADSEDYPIYDKTAYQDGEKIPDWTSMIDNYKVPISMDKIVHEEERKLLINFNELKAQ